MHFPKVSVALAGQVNLLEELVFVIQSKGLFVLNFNHTALIRS